MKNEGLVNVGQLIREQCGAQNIYIVGFGTHRGTVIAADSWGSELKRMMVPPAQTYSWEDLLHQEAPMTKSSFLTRKMRIIFIILLDIEQLG